MATISYEVPILQKGWHETSANYEKAAISAIQELTEWSAEQAEAGHVTAASKLDDAEWQYRQEAAQKCWDEHGYYPSEKSFVPNVAVAIEGYTIKRELIKGRHSSENGRYRYTWKNN